MNDEDLKIRFPLSKFWLVKKTAFLAIMFVAALFVVYQIGFAFSEDTSQLIFNLTFYCGVVVLIIRISYLYLYMRAYEYKVVGDEILITRGVIMKTPVGIPISKIHAIHIRRNLIDYILGTATAVIILPGDMPLRLASIEGLSNKSANNFKSYIFQIN